ncbi:MAG: hypothetical protein C3F02_00380 [Parcubacteria group bacterium]|nr:MAG: hypothetical protein C3F02_00380 [Parcubacteria group bacterium]
MKILFITRKVDKDDGLAGFTYYWIKKMAGQVSQLAVICLEKGNTFGLPENVNIHSLGKEKGKNRLREFFVFQKLAWQLVPKVDGIFSHQNPEYGILISPYAKIFHKKLIAWYAHGAVSFKVRLLNMLVDKIVTSTEAGFKLNSKKKIVLHQGIDGDIFVCKKRPAHRELRLLSVSRISPVKNIDKMIVLAAELKSRGQEVVLKIAGQASLPQDHQCLDSLKQLVRERNLSSQVEFLGSVPNYQTPFLYEWADVFLNFSQTASLDKTILEAMSCGSLVFSSNESAIKILNTLEPQMAVNNFDHLSADILSLVQKDNEALRQRIHQYVVDNHELGDLFKEVLKLF